MEKREAFLFEEIIKDQFQRGKCPLTSPWPPFDENPLGSTVEVLSMKPPNINSPQQPQPKIKCKEDGHSSEDDELCIGTSLHFNRTLIIIKSCIN